MKTPNKNKKERRMRQTFEASTTMALLLLAACQGEATLKPTPVKPNTPGQSAPTTASSGLSASQVMVLLEAQSAAIRGCFIEEAKWVLSVSLRVEPSGQVSQANVFDLMQGSAAATCAEGLLRGLRFPVFFGDAQRVSYSYMIRPRIEPAESSAVPIPVAQSQPFGLSQGSPAPWSVPADASAALLQAEKFFALGELEAAEKALAPFQDKPLPEMLYLLGGVAAKRGEVGAMCGYYRRYVEASPQSPAVPGLQRQISGACTK
jgi:hypothetical protein